MIVTCHSQGCYLPGSGRTSVPFLPEPTETSATAYLAAEYQKLQTSAMSIRIPLGRPLNVGGKRENIAKLMVVETPVLLGCTRTAKVF